jgi:hypothetical protein
MIALEKIKWHLLLSISLMIAESAVSAHTGIGSGGDVVAAYLEETRARFVEALQKFQTEDTRVQEAVCKGQGLTPQMERDCAIFLRTVTDAMVRFHSGPRHLPFELSKDPVTVIGPDGSSLRVAAKTLTGPEGSVTFDYGLILRRSPKLLMALVAHETGHKVEFRHGIRQNPRLYIEDDAPVLAFATGRALLDAAGLAIANFAEHIGIIGQQFSVRDKFYCEIKPSNGGIGFYQSGDDEREFLTPQSDETPYNAFRSGISPDRKLQVGVTQGNTCLSLDLMMNEVSGCLADGNITDRYVDLKVYRLFRPEPDGTVRPPVLLTGRRIDNWNPACEEEQPARERPMAIEVEGLVFTCTYKGMAAATHLSVARTKRFANACPGS